MITDSRIQNHELIESAKQKFIAEIDAIFVHNRDKITEMLFSNGVMNEDGAKNIASKYIFETFLYQRIFEYKQTDYNRVAILTAIHEEYEYRMNPDYMADVIRRVNLYFEKFELPVLNLSDMRDKQIHDILSLPNTNKYKIRLYSVLLGDCYNPMPEIQKYNAINSVIGDYYFYVVMPAEDEQLKRQREEQKKATEHEVEIEVSVYNPNDITEVAIKENLTIGQVIIGGYAEMYRLMGGVEKLCIKKRNGTVRDKLDGGYQKELARNITDQYIATKKVDKGRYAIQITDIFEQPILSIFDNRGKHTVGYYSKRLMPIFIDYLIEFHNQNQYGDLYSAMTNVTEIAREIGIVKNDYRRKVNFTRNDSRFTIPMVNRFYGKCNTELTKIIHRMLNNLKKTYGVIDYKENYWIITENDKYGEGHTSEPDEESIINRTKVKILKEFGAFDSGGMFTIFARNQEEEFYSRMVEYINETYDRNWVKFISQIEIVIEDFDALKELRQILANDADELSVGLAEAKTRLATRLYKDTYADYNRANRKEYEIITNDPNLPDDVKELLELGVITPQDVVRKGILKNKPFHYYDSTLQTQCDLIKLFVGMYDVSVSDDEQELPF